MTYVTGNIPVGAYDSRRLANIGIGHGAVDAGGGYTYFNPQTGQEFSAVLGFTYNFDNQSTQYQNGVDMHLDWGASQFITKQCRSAWSATSTSSSPATAARATGSAASSRASWESGRRSATSSRSATLQGYINLKGYKEFDAAHRPEGWNAWLTFAISPAERGTAAGHDQEVAGALEPQSRSLTARWSKGGAPRSTTEWLTTVKPPLQRESPGLFRISMRRGKSPRPALALHGRRFTARAFSDGTGGFSFRCSSCTDGGSQNRIVRGCPTLVVRF